MKKKVLLFIVKFSVNNQFAHAKSNIEQEQTAISANNLTVRYDLSFNGKKILFIFKLKNISVCRDRSSAVFSEWCDFTDESHP